MNDAIVYLFVLTVLFAPLALYLGYLFDKSVWLKRISWYNWWLLFLVGNVVDIHSTSVALSSDVQEFNPVVSYLIQKVGIEQTALFHKGGIVIAALLVGFYFSNRLNPNYIRSYNGILFIVCVALFMAAFWNYSLALFPR